MFELSSALWDLAIAIFALFVIRRVPRDQWLIIASYALMLPLVYVLTQLPSVIESVNAAASAPLPMPDPSDPSSYYSMPVPGTPFYVPGFSFLIFAGSWWHALILFVIGVTIQLSRRGYKVARQRYPITA